MKCFNCSFPSFKISCLKFIGLGYMKTNSMYYASGLLILTSLHS